MLSFWLVQSRFFYDETFTYFTYSMANRACLQWRLHNYILSIILIRQFWIERRMKYSLFDWLLLLFAQDAQEPSGIQEEKSGFASFDSILLLSKHPRCRFHTTFLRGHLSVYATPNNIIGLLYWLCRFSYMLTFAIHTIATMDEPSCIALPRKLFLVFGEQPSQFDGKIEGHSYSLYVCRRFTCYTPSLPHYVPSFTFR